MASSKTGFIGFIVCLLSLAAAGCPSRDNPYDPINCDQPCANNEHCWNGRCVANDDGGLDSGEQDSGEQDSGEQDSREQDSGNTDDAGADAGAVSPAITFSSREIPDVSITTSSSDFIDIPDLAPQTVLANGQDNYLVILNLPSTWVDGENQGAGFRIVDGDTTLASGYYTSTTQVVVPVTLFAARQLQAGSHTIKAQWTAGPNKHDIYLGGERAWLVVVRADEQDLQFKSEVFDTSPSLAPNSNWYDLSTLTVKTSGDYLVLMSAPVVHSTNTGGCGQFRIEDEASSMLAGGNICNWAFANQALPLTMAGVTKLDAGDVIRSQWASNNTSISLEKSNGAENTPWLIALRMPEGFASGKSAAAETKTTSSSPVPVNSSAQPITVTPTVGGNHLFFFNAPETSTDKPGYLRFQMTVDGTLLASTGPSYPTFSHHLPVTMIGVKELTTSKPYSVGVEWFAGYGAEGTLGANYPHWLVAFTR